MIIPGLPIKTAHSTIILSKWGFGVPNGIAVFPEHWNDAKINEAAKIICAERHVVLTNRLACIFQGKYDGVVVEVFAAMNANFDSELILARPSWNQETLAPKFKSQFSSDSLEEALRVTGIFPEESARQASVLRQLYPKGIAANDLLKAVKNANGGHEFLEAYALRALAMLPCTDIQGELLNRLVEVESRPNTSEHYYDLQFILLQSLGYIGSKVGIQKYNIFAKLMAEMGAQIGVEKTPIKESELEMYIQEFSAWRAALFPGK